ncbi:epoxide hydrolase 1 [Metarhizium album ARSEF 1941]|uniref:Epoxide hydrolase 1 n=1 Tax=Metarhizium album (strain ARSEF 1941) TaxID=1081103 RepID=A0A0B2WRG0_METAS|nr:epoxide hydrolase 1 [Metarhizium album ARSEF 1941]KHN96082.1 epoxide hydrolase 1 [Metarhizium album ARSEF 1941]
MADYAKLPAGATLAVTPFKAHVDEEKLRHFRKLLELSPIAPAVFENTHAGDRYGLRREWLETAKAVWLDDFDWREHEDGINSYPNFKTAVGDAAGNTIDVHFLALFSRRPDAVPVALLHGWPGSACDFLDMLDLVRRRFPPEDLPYHVVVPSLPGYAYSSGPPAHVDYGVDMAAGAMHNLMVGLGFASGYLVHGGDLGSFVARIMALQYPECRGMHVSMMGVPPLDENPPRTDDEKQALRKALEFLDTAHGFALQQGQRPATVGLALSASPLALLGCWPVLLTSQRLQEGGGGGTRPTGTDDVGGQVSKLTALQLPYVAKPCGYSLFAREIFPVPETWARLSCNLVSFSEHPRGGHFAAMEQPGALLADVEEYIRKAWPRPD